MTDIVDQLKTRFDPRIVFPDEMSREAAAEIERLRHALASLAAPAGVDGELVAEPIADVRFSCGRSYLRVAGVVVAMEGDKCRDGGMPEEVFEPIPPEELATASIGGKLAKDLPIDVVRFFRGDNWTPKMLEWVAGQINAAVAKAKAAPPAGEYDHEREQGPRYAAELDAAAEILQRVHPAGQCKAFGRLEVVAADDGPSRLPAGRTRRRGRRRLA